MKVSFPAITPEELFKQDQLAHTWNSPGLRKFRRKVRYEEVQPPVREREIADAFKQHQAAMESFKNIRHLVSFAEDLPEISLLDSDPIDPPYGSEGNRIKVPGYPEFKGYLRAFPERE